MNNPVDPGDAAALKRMTRQLWGGILYRGFVGLAFLMFAFSMFPGYGPIFGAGYILFNQTVSGVAGLITTLIAEDRVRTDVAERKTRHTILLAHRLSAEGSEIDDWAFWDQVNKNVAGEYPNDAEAAKKPRWWKTVGLVLWNALARLLGDLLTIAVAATLTSG